MVIWDLNRVKSGKLSLVMVVLGYFSWYHLFYEGNENYAEKVKLVD